MNSSSLFHSPGEIVFALLDPAVEGIFVVSFADRKRCETKFGETMIREKLDE